MIGLVQTLVESCSRYGVLLPPANMQIHRREDSMQGYLPPPPPQPPTVPTNHLTLLFHPHTRFPSFLPQLLDRQIQQESFGGFSGSQSSLEYPSTSTEKARLLKEREQAMGHSEALQPVLNIIYLQLQLLGSMHECNQVGVAMGGV